MRSASILIFLGAWASALALAQGTRLPEAPNANTKPLMLKSAGIEQKLNAQVPLQLLFNDEAGRPVTLGKFFTDKPVILALVYYECPMLCNLTLNGLVRSLHPMNLSAGDDFQLVAVSINPRETPQIAMAKKENYLEKYQRAHGREGWHFLTGKEQQIRELAKAVGFDYAYDPINKQFAHAAGIMVATPEGKLSRYYYGIEFPTRDLKFGLIEASQHKIGTPADKILLYCYHYDPVTGKYGFMISRVLQVLGSATALLLGAFVFFSIRRERRTA